MSEQFAELAQELDRESWDWLTESHPSIAHAIHLSVERGARPEQVRSFVLLRCGTHRQEFARRCESAARHLAGAK